MEPAVRFGTGCSGPGLIEGASTQDGPGLVPAELLVDLSAVLCPRAELGQRADQSDPSAWDIVDRCQDFHAKSILHEFLDGLEKAPLRVRAAVLEALDSVQIRSKLWLIEELTRVRDIGGTHMLVVGAWYGVLPFLLNLRIRQPPALITCVDIDPAPCRVGESLIGRMFANVEYRCADGLHLDYSSWAEGPESSVVVNTICEHLTDVSAWWSKLPPGQCAVLQSNDYRGCADHISPVGGLAEFKRQAPMTEVWFEGMLPLSIFNRYMLIGVR